MKHALAGPDEMVQYQRQLPLRADQRRMFGQNECRRLFARGFEIPQKVGEPFPDLHARGFIVAEPEDWARATLERELGTIRIDAGTDGRGVARSASSIGSKSSSGVPR